MVFLDDTGKDWGALNKKRSQVYREYTDRDVKPSRRQKPRPFRWMVDVHLEDGMSAPDMTVEEWNRLNPSEPIDPDVLEWQQIQ